MLSHLVISSSPVEGENDYFNLCGYTFITWFMNYGLRDFSVSFT